MAICASGIVAKSVFLGKNSHNSAFAFSLLPRCQDAAIGRSGDDAIIAMRMPTVTSSNITMAHTLRHSTHSTIPTLHSTTPTKPWCNYSCACSSHTTSHPTIQFISSIAYGASCTALVPSNPHQPLLCPLIRQITFVSCYNGILPALHTTHRPMILLSISNQFQPKSALNCMILALT